VRHPKAIPHPKAFRPLKGGPLRTSALWRLLFSFPRGDEGGVPCPVISMMNAASMVTLSFQVRRPMVSFRRSLETFVQAELVVVGVVASDQLIIEECLDFAVADLDEGGVSLAGNPSNGRRTLPAARPKLVAFGPSRTSTILPSKAASDHMKLVAMGLEDLREGRRFGLRSERRCSRTQRVGYRGTQSPDRNRRPRPGCCF